MSDEAPPPTATVAREVRRHRDQLHWSAARLAEEVAANGGKLTRQAISKIENGMRDVAIDDLLVLGRALRVPPLLLLFPVGYEHHVNMSGSGDSTWVAARWFAGEASFDGSDISSDPGAAPLVLYRQHQTLIDEYVRFVFTYPEAPPMTEEMVRKFTEPLGRVRQEIRRQGLLVPWIPERLAKEVDPPPVMLTAAGVTTASGVAVVTVTRHEEAASRRTAEETPHEQEGE